MSLLNKKTKLLVLLVNNLLNLYGYHIKKYQSLQTLERELEETLLLFQNAYHLHL